MEKLIKIRNQKEVVNWQKSGALLKPENCKLCALGAIGKSFVPDWCPENPKIAFILGLPSQQDAIEQQPFSGASGYHFTKLFIEDLGLKKEEVLISHNIRCVQPINQYGKREYPTQAFLKRAGEMNCRFYDTGLNDFNPNLFILTLDPTTIYGVGAHLKQIQRDIGKAIRFTIKGYKCAVIFGDGPASFYFPSMKNNGGIKNWRGHWWLGELPFKNRSITEKEINRKLFVEGFDCT